MNDFAGTTNAYEAPQVFFSTLFIILAPQYLVGVLRDRQHKKRRRVILCGIVLMILAVVWPFVGVVLNGFVYPSSRFLMVLAPLFA